MEENEYTLKHNRHGGSWAQESLGPRTLVFLSDVETDVWPAGTLERLAAGSAGWLVTRGEQGADHLTPSSFVHMPAVEVWHPPSPSPWLFISFLVILWISSEGKTTGRGVRKEMLRLESRMKIRTKRRKERLGGVKGAG